MGGVETLGSKENNRKKCNKVSCEGITWMFKKKEKLLVNSHKSTGIFYDHKKRNPDFAKLVAGCTIVLHFLIKITMNCLDFEVHYRALGQI